MNTIHRTLHSTCLLVLLILGSSGCSRQESPADTRTASPQPTTARAAAATLTSTPTATATPLPAATSTPTVTSTTQPSDTPPAPTITPTALPPTSTPPPPTPEHAGPILTVQADTLNIRGGPGITFPVVGQAPRGQLFSAIARTADGSWVQIDLDGMEGWLYGPMVAAEGDLTLLPEADGPPANQIPSVQLTQTTVTIPSYPYAEFTEDAFNAQFNWTYLRFDRDAYQASDPQPVDKTYHLLLLENEYLRLSILPELGGRLYEAVFKPTGNNEFYRNPVIKPSPWGPPEQGGWLAAGGMTWDLPVEEHGYAWAMPWGHITVQYDPSTAGVTVFMPNEGHLRGDVDITLRAGGAAFTVEPRIVNPTDQDTPYKFWITAMLAPGPGDRPSEELRFIYPTDAMTVHSRGDDHLPEGNEMMSWPTVDGQDLSRLGNWNQWLGFFERPAAHGPFTAVYDERFDEGMVRVFPADAAPGSKGFGLGWATAIDPAYYTDGDSAYVEIHGGVAPTYENQATLPAGATYTWQETWYPVAGIGGITYADRGGALHVGGSHGRLEIGVFPVREIAGKLLVTLDDQIVFEKSTQLSPASPFHQDLPVERLVGGRQVSVTLFDQDGEAVLHYAGTLSLDD
ncbi:MAG: DUF5107 domain-containing protein [Chloroflexota bacterium]|nr:DUF5107 domain-containing protein [Chloroflexota bacterium]